MRRSPQFEARWAPGTRERRAMYLLLYTGQRRSDASRMGRQHVKRGKIKRRAGQGRRQAHGYRCTRG
jgi:hypothetical protein